MGLRTKVLLPLMFLSLLLLSYLYGYWMPHSLANIEDKYRASVERHIESVAEALVPLLLARQLDSVYEDLDTLKKRNTDWISVRLFDDKGRMIYPLKTMPPASKAVPARDIHTIEQQIDYLDAHIGKLTVEVDFTPRLSAIKERHIELITLLLLIIAGYIVTTGFVLDRAARRPINLLAQASRRLAEGDFSATLPKAGGDEVGTLVNSFQDMRDTIRNYQAELKMAGNYNRSLIEASLDPLVTIDADGKVTDVNAATEKVTGHTREELIGTDFTDYFTEPAKARAGYQQAFREGTVRDYALEIRHRDGHVTPVLYNASVFRNEKGEVAGVFAAARDITERMLVEGRLREQREFLKKTIESLTHPFYVIDASDYKIMMANAAARLDVFSEVNTCYALTHRRDRPCSGDNHLCPLEIVKRTKKPAVVEHIHYDRDGNTRVAEVHGYPILDDKGNVAQMIEYALDITDRKLAEDTLKESEARLKEAQRIAHLGHWELDLKKNVLRWSDEVYRIFGLEPQAFGATYEAFLQHVHPDDRDFVNGAYTNSVKNRTSYDIEHRILKDGEIRYVNERCFTEYGDQGIPLRSIGTVLDITERRKAEEEIRSLNAELEQRVVRRTAELQKKSRELEEANNKLKELDQLKSMFIASMSHELRTPLNSIIGFSSITLEEWTGPLNDEQKKNLATVLRSGRHLLALVNDIIDISKIEAGKHEVVLEEFDLNSLITDAVSLFRKETEEKGLELSVESPHLEMHTDRRRLLQCLVNLVSNAVKFTERGKITIAAGLVSTLKEEVQPEYSAKDVVRISVTDTGIGMKKEDLPKLFSAFTRIPSPLSIKVKGTGLGLYLVKKIATEILMGDVAVQSTLGEGSSFCLRIPIKL